jgi:hypothetical protein
MHFVLPSMIQDDAGATWPFGGAKQVQIAATKCNYPHPLALPKNEVGMKNCKAASGHGTCA